MDYIIMEHNRIKLRKIMTEEERKVEDFMRFDIYMIVCSLAQLVQFRLHMIETMNNAYRNKLFMNIKWGLWLFITAMTILGKMTKQPILLKVAFHLQYVAHIAVIFNSTNSKLYDDTAQITALSTPLTCGMFCLIYIPICFVERVYVHVPITIIYQGITSFGIFSMYAGVQVGHSKRFSHVLENQMSLVIL